MRRESRYATGTSTPQIERTERRVGQTTVPLESIAPQGDVQQSLGDVERRDVGDEQGDERPAEQVARSDQYPFDRVIERNRRAHDAWQALEALRADGLCPEDGRRDADRDGRELHVADDLVDRAVRRRRARTEVIDERDHRDFG